MTVSSHSPCTGWSCLSCCGDHHGRQDYLRKGAERNKNNHRQVLLQGTLTASNRSLSMSRQCYGCSWLLVKVSVTINHFQSISKLDHHRCLPFWLSLVYKISCTHHGMPRGWLVHAYVTYVTSFSLGGINREISCWSYSYHSPFCPRIQGESKQITCSSLFIFRVVSSSS